MNAEKCTGSSYKALDIKSTLIAYLAWLTASVFKRTHQKNRPNKLILKFKDNGDLYQYWAKNRYFNYKYSWIQIDL